jgi:small-conductance mechanosensitive channel
MIPLWIVAILVFVGSFFIAQLAKNAMENKIPVHEEELSEGHKEIQTVLGRVTYAGVLIVGITIALKIGGLDMTPIVAACAFGLSFALQDIATNFIAGVMVLLSRHYTIGDIVTVGSTTGKIIEIQSRATILRAFDGTKVIIPNSELLNNTVVSKTSNPVRRLRVVMGVGYEADLKKTVHLTLEALKLIPGILQEPLPSVIFYEWGDYSINYYISVWVSSKNGPSTLKLKSDIIMALSEVYNASDLDIPYPIQTVQYEHMEKSEPVIKPTGTPLRPLPQMMTVDAPDLLED